MKKLLLILLCLPLLFSSCSKEDDEIIEKGYDIILIIGQSNTNSGIGYDNNLDASDIRIKQLGRYYDRDLKVILAEDPLDHHTIEDEKIGFGLVFAKEYLKYNSEREVLLIPCGYGGTGFIDNRWNKGDDLYNDAVDRVKYIINTFPESNLKVILWHQGEKDAVLVNNDYQLLLDQFIDNIRKDLNSDSVPFILGGMVPYWVGLDSNRLYFQNIISQTPFRVHNTGYADPTIPFLIVKEDNNLDTIHYDATGQREMGRRYFQESLNLIQ